MKRSLTSLLTGIAVSTMLAGCNSSSTSTDSLVTTDFTITSSSLDAVAQTNMQKLFSLFLPSAVALTPPLLVDSNGANVSLGEAWIVVKKVEFKAEEMAGADEVDGDEVEYEGPYFVDLLSDAPVSFGQARVQARHVRRVKMQLHEAESLPASAPLGLQSKSIYLSGAVNGLAFTYAADDSTELEFGGPNPIMPNSSKNLLAVIRIADLFKKIDLSAVSDGMQITATNRVTAMGACPLIDASANDLYTCFRKGLASEASFGNDDGDMDLGPEDETVD